MTGDPNINQSVKIYQKKTVQTFNITHAEVLSVLLQGLAHILFMFHLNKGLSVGLPILVQGQVNALHPVTDPAF